MPNLEPEAHQDTVLIPKPCSSPSADTHLNLLHAAVVNTSATHVQHVSFVATVYVHVSFSVFAVLTILSVRPPPVLQVHHYFITGKGPIELLTGA
jgi:hypothetical protein